MKSMSKLCIENNWKVAFLKLKCRLSLYAHTGLESSKAATIILYHPICNLILSCTAESQIPNTTICNVHSTVFWFTTSFEMVALIAIISYLCFLGFFKIVVLSVKVFLLKPTLSLFLWELIHLLIYIQSSLYFTISRNKNISQIIKNNSNCFFFL